VFIVGAILFTAADIIVENDGGSGVGIPVRIGLDSIRDPLAIGASIAVAGPLLSYLCSWEYRIFLRVLLLTMK
jgi:hypothetical protein